MTYEQLWAAITKNNPRFLADGANLTPAGLEKLVKTAYEQGHKQGLANGKALVGKPGVANKRDLDFLAGMMGMGHLIK